MPRKKSPPSYRLHKARNCAVVTINRRNHYLGPYESAESYAKYARLIADWEVSTADRAPRDFSVLTPRAVSRSDPNYYRT